MDSQEARQRFENTVASPDHEIDLARAALLIAASEYPELDVEGQLGLLDSLAAGASRRIGGDREALSSVNRLSEYLFDEVGFAGNQDDYYDPRNCYLNEVLARRLGIPIMLSLVCILVGNRLGIPLVGVGMPGHFLVRHRDEEALFIDPFHRGILISEEECAERLRQVTHSNAAWDSRYLNPVNNRDFIARMLRNLKGIYLHRQDNQRALTAIDRLVVLLPQAPEERRDRGLLNYQLGHYQEALDDLRHYLGSTPPDTDKETVQRLVGQIEDLMSRQ